MDIVLATRNNKKSLEMTRIFEGLGIRFLTLQRFPGCPEVEEDGKTFRANALKKAREVARFTGYPSLADDSGLEVDALGGAPGVLSARYAGPGADDQKNLRKLLGELRNIPEESRGAEFKCCMAFVLPDGRFRTFTGRARGRIGIKALGNNGFGYDPVFFPEGREKTFAQMTAPEKDRLSHRGKAMRKLYNYLRKSC